jgi:glycine cleavage system transcriptional repressor
MAETKKLFVISIMSRDRIGIVYQVSSAISELEGDIADIRQSVLRGYFTMILLASFPASTTPDQARRALLALNVAGEPSLEVTVKQADDTLATGKVADLDNAYVLTASGPDRIGFVATVASFCAKHSMNILDLSTVVDGSSYVMMLLVDLEQCPEDIGEIRHKLARFGEETELTIVLQHYRIFSAANEVGVL